MTAFDHRASILDYIESLASRKEAGNLPAATELRALASSIKAKIDISAGRRNVASPVQVIIHATVDAFGGAASYAEILGPSRAIPICRVRWASMWVARKRLGKSEGEIEADFQRERTSVAHGIRQAESLRNSDSAYREITDRLAAQPLLCEHCLHPLFSS